MMKENDFDLRDAFDRVVKGLQNEMNAVISKIEQSRDTSPDGWKSMIKTGLESVVLAVEKVLDGISDGMAEARKIKEREEMRMKVDENWKREQDMKKRVRDVKKMEERLEKMEDRMRNERKVTEEENKKLLAKICMLEEENKLREKDMLNDIRKMEEKVVKVINQTREEMCKITDRVVKVEEGKGKEGVEKEIRSSQNRIQEAEAAIAKERKDREALAREVAKEMKIREIKESEKEMEEKVQAAMEQIKILDLNFDRVCENSNMLVKETVERLKGKVGGEDRKECEQILRQSRIRILGQRTEEKEVGGVKIFTVPVLVECGCLRDKLVLEEILKKVGNRVAFQWPKEILEFVSGVREEVERMGYKRSSHFVRVRPR